MSWIILEGLDRTGKSSVAKLYESNGYHVVHFKSPDKRYSEDGYIGPSYFEDIMEMYVSMSGQDIVFDRSIYGELVWPKVYGRKPLLTDEEIEELKEIEMQNGVQPILMYDSNVKAHWERCVSNNEPLNEQQFRMARKLFDEVATKHGFSRKKLGDFGLAATEDGSSEASAGEGAEQANDGLSTQSDLQANDGGDNRSEVGKNNRRVRKRGGDQTLSAKTKLEKANAINTVLEGRIIRKKGEMYDSLEKDIRNFLEEKLSIILGGRPDNSFSDEEVQMLKLYCQRLKVKMEEKR